jgi:hypothetical protein
VRLPPSIQDWFSPPPVNLALFRMAFGLVCMIDVLRRLSTVSIFFSADGLTPLQLNYGGAFTLFQFFPDAPGVAFGVLFVLACASLLLIIGYRTRWAQVVLLVGFASLHNRNPMLINAGDSVQMVFLWWTLFLPLGSAWSLDAKRSRARVSSGNAIAAAAFFACRVQVALIYGFAALNKSGPIYASGDAMHYILRQDNLTTAFGAALGQACSPQVLMLLTRLGLQVEILIPVLLFLPIWTTWPRRIAIVLICSLHLFIESFGHFGLLSFYMMTLAPLFIPARDTARFGPTGASTPPDKPSPAYGASALYFVLLLFVFEAIRINPISKKLLPRPIPETPLLTAAQDHLHLDQGWIMFAPNPYTDTRFTAILFDYGDTTQLWPLEASPQAKGLTDHRSLVLEAHLPAWYKGQFLHNYMSALDGPPYSTQLASFLMRSEGDRPFHFPVAPMSLEIISVFIEIPPPGTSLETPPGVLLIPVGIPYPL